MKDILLGKKWAGAIALAVYTIIVAIFFTNMGVKFILQNAPVVEKEVNVFLPVTIAGGEITAPQNTIISRTYGSGNDILNVVLDTSTDEIETSVLKDKGLYISRKYIYAVSENKTEIHDFKNVPDILIDSEVLHDFSELVQSRAGIYIFVFMLVAFGVWATIAIWIYSFIMQWALKSIFHNDFALTLRINTFAYIGVSVLTMLAGFNISAVSTFIVLFGVNFGVNKWLQTEKTEK